MANLPPTKLACSSRWGGSSSSRRWPSALLRRLSAPGPGEGAAPPAPARGLSQPEPFVPRPAEWLLPQPRLPLGPAASSGCSRDGNFHCAAGAEPSGRGEPGPRPRTWQRPRGAASARALPAALMCRCPAVAPEGLSPGMCPCSCTVFGWQRGPGLCHCPPPGPRCWRALAVPVPQAQARRDPGTCGLVADVGSSRGEFGL